MFEVQQQVLVLAARLPPVMPWCITQCLASLLPVQLPARAGPGKQQGKGQVPGHCHSQWEPRGEFPALAVTGIQLLQKISLVCLSIFQTKGNIDIFKSLMRSR